MKIIALDIGSSFLKSAVLDTEANTLVHKTRTPTPARLANEDAACFELDADLLYQGVIGLVDDQIEKEPEVKGILFSTQMHGFVLTRGETAITPYVSWQDTRAERPKLGGSDLEKLQGLLGQEAISSMGTRYKAGIAACSLYSYLKDHTLDLSDAMFHTLGSYLIYRMSGGKRHACHLTSAASTGFANAPKRCWNQRTIDMVGAGALSFPEIVCETEPLGDYRGVPLFADIGDHQASVYGSVDQIENIATSVVITLGTGGILCAPVKGYVKADMEVRPFFEGSSLMTITRQPGGRAMDVVIDFYADILEKITGQKVDKKDIWKAMWQHVKADTQALSVKPDFYIGQGEGAIQNIGKDNLTACNLFAATMDGLANAYAAAIAKLRALNPAIDRIVLCGGKLSKSEEMRKRIEQATGLPTAFSPKEDEALWGLCHIAKRIQ